MGKVEVTYKNKNKLLEETLKTTDVVLSILKMMRERIELSPDEFSSVLNESNDPSLSENRNLDYYIQKGGKSEGVYLTDEKLYKRKKHSDKGYRGL